MAGKKGRSGRKKKNAVKPPVMPAAQPAPVKQEAVIQPAGDPFLKIEEDLKTKLPPPAPEGAAGSPQPVKKAPENLARFICNGFYRLEDGFGRAYLGLGTEYAGVLMPTPENIDAHVKPLCQVAEKYVPTDFLNKIDENMPEISLGIAFLDAQLGFFAKLQQAKAEMKRKPAEKQAETGQTIPNGTSYPSPDEIRRP